ncbi:MAG: hypothetical protein RSD49_14670 [Hafnia sp.]
MERVCNSNTLSKGVSVLAEKVKKIVLSPSNWQYFFDNVIIVLISLAVLFTVSYLYFEITYLISIANANVLGLSIETSGLPWIVPVGVMGSEFVAWITNPIVEQLYSASIVLICGSLAVMSFSFSGYKFLSYLCELGRNDDVASA